MVHHYHCCSLALEIVVQVHYKHSGLVPAAEHMDYCPSDQTIERAVAVAEAVAVAAVGGRDCNLCSVSVLGFRRLPLGDIVGVWKASVASLSADTFAAVEIGVQGSLLCDVEIAAAVKV